MAESSNQLLQLVLKNQEEEKLFELIRTDMALNLVENLHNWIAKDVNLNMQNKFGHTPLMKTIQKINLEALKVVLKAIFSNSIFNINQQDNAGFTALNFLEKAIQDNQFSGGLFLDPLKKSTSFY